MANSKKGPPKLRTRHMPTKVHQDRTKLIPRKKKHKDFVSASTEVESFETRFSPGDFVIDSSFSWSEAKKLGRPAHIYKITAIDFSYGNNRDLVYVTEVHFFPPWSNPVSIVKREKDINYIDKNCRKLTKAEKFLYIPL